MPGKYTIVRDNVRVSYDSQILGVHTTATLSLGTVVDVVEVITHAHLDRIRARLVKPEGWISLENTKNKNRWAERDPDIATKAVSAMQKTLAAAGDLRYAGVIKAKPDVIKAPPRKLTKEERDREERVRKLKKVLAERRAKEKDFVDNYEFYKARAEAFMNGTGEYADKKKEEPKAQDLRIRMPTHAERDNTRKMYLGQFRAEYNKLKEARIRNAQSPCTTGTSPTGLPSASPDLSTYSEADAAGLTLKGAHMEMVRPDDVKMPDDYMKPVGVIPLAKLKEYNCERKDGRLLVSVYGEIFDVSDRPDKYDPDGPYWFMSGADITWGFVAGRDSEDMCNGIYDLWKIAPESTRDHKFKTIYAWLCWYEFEYGNAVGQLEEYQKEVGCKGPPMEDEDNCSIM
jgi:hypothetical protein